MAIGIGRGSDEPMLRDGLMCDIFIRISQGSDQPVLRDGPMCDMPLENR